MSNIRDKSQVSLLALKNKRDKRVFAKYPMQLYKLWRRLGDGFDGHISMGVVALEANVFEQSVDLRTSLSLGRYELRKRKSHCTTINR